MSSIHFHQRRRFFLSLVAPLTVISLTFILLLYGVARFYYFVWTPNVDLGSRSSTILYIPSGSDFGKLLRIIRSQEILRNEKSFISVSLRKHYNLKVKAGKYRIRNRMTNNELVNLLRSGLQEPVKLSFQSARSPSDLAGRLGRQIEADSSDFMSLFRDKDYLRAFGISPDCIFVLFIPNTYEIYWNTSAKQLMDRMYKEMNLFWNAQRKTKLDSSGLSISEAMTLASIVEKETNAVSEKPDIAGVYMNRLKKKWPLQADPTIIYAWQDYSIKRVTNVHLKIKSRYNTYLNTGLPPGPICIPSVSSIDAVLNFRKHKYMYFCAKEDLSGTHNFAETLSQHLANAKKYQKALNEMNIR